MSQITFEYQDKNGELLEVDVSFIAVFDPAYSPGSAHPGIECWSLEDYSIEIYSENVNITKQLALARPDEFDEIMALAADKALDHAASQDPEIYEDE